MRYQEFTDLLEKGLSARLGNVIIEEVETVHLNDNVSRGVNIREVGSRIAPNFFLDDAYADYESGNADFADILNWLVKEFLRVSGSSVQSHVPDEGFSLSDIEDRLGVRLVEMSRNKKWLEDKPYTEVGNGLAISYDIDLSEDLTTSVTTDMLKDIGLSIEELSSLALENASKRQPAVLSTPENKTLSKLLPGYPVRNLLSRDDLIAGNAQEMYILSDGTPFGAAALFYPGVKEKIARFLGDSYYILPLTLNEVFIVPEYAKGENTDNDIQSFNAFVQSQRDSSEALSDATFRYDVLSGAIEMV